MPRNIDRTALTIAASALALWTVHAASALADHKPGHGHHDAGQHDHHHEPSAQQNHPPTQALTGASKAYDEAMQKMHKDMAIPYTGDVDLDFVRGMIPHHQGAIEQAEVLLKYSKNPRLRLLAGGIIAAQKREIRFMKYWLEQHQKGIESKDMPVWLRSNPANLEDANAADDQDAKAAPKN